MKTKLVSQGPPLGHAVLFPWNCHSKGFPLYRVSTDPISEMLPECIEAAFRREKGNEPWEKGFALFRWTFLACPVWLAMSMIKNPLKCPELLTLFLFQLQKYYILFTLSSCLELTEQVLFYYFNPGFPFLNYFKERLFFLTNKSYMG